MLNKAISAFVKFASVLSILTVFSVAQADHKTDVDSEISVLCGHEEGCPDINSDYDDLNYNDNIDQAKENSTGKTVPLPLDNVKIEQGTKNYVVYDFSTGNRQSFQAFAGEKIKLDSNMTFVNHYSQDGVQYIVIKHKDHVTNDDKQFMQSHQTLIDKIKAWDNAKKERYNQYQQYSNSFYRWFGYITSLGSSSRSWYKKTNDHKTTDKQALEKAHKDYLAARKDLKMHLAKINVKSNQFNSSSDEKNHKRGRKGLRGSQFAIDEEYTKPSKTDRIISGSSEVSSGYTIQRANSALMD